MNLTIEFHFRELCQLFGYSQRASKLTNPILFYLFRSEKLSVVVVSYISRFIGLDPLRAFQVKIILLEYRPWSVNFVSIQNYL